MAEEKVPAGDQDAIEARRRHHVPDLASTSDIKSAALPLLGNKDLSALHDAIVIIFNCSPEKTVVFRLVLQFTTTNMSLEEKFDRIVEVRNQQSRL